MSSVIDTHSNVDFAKVYREKMGLTADDLLNDRVLPLFDANSIKVHRVLTDKGAELCGRQDSQPHELFLHINDPARTASKVRHPQTNGSAERLNQTIQDEFYQVACRKKLYRSIEEIELDLEAFMDYKNQQRNNKGLYCQ